jgi:5'-deoxynucleotidase YfbR-like HD superfamily hydrolase
MPPAPLQNSHASGLDQGVAARLAKGAPLFAQLQDLKRMRCAGGKGTLAEAAFLRAWSLLAADVNPRLVAAETLRCALIDNQFAGLRGQHLRESGLPDDLGIQLESAAVAKSVEGAFEDHPLLSDRLDREYSGEEPPAFARRLAEQPRAGATHPTEGRLLLTPAESHADHCWGVAVIGVLLAPYFDADPGDVFLAAFGHHLHNAYMPDSGFAGEMLMEPHLNTIIRAFRSKALRELPEALQSEAERVHGLLESMGPEAQAFHAADVLDRVLDVSWRAEVAGFSLKVATGRYGLVHDGPQKAYHDEVLSLAGISA